MSLKIDFGDLADVLNTAVKNLGDIEKFTKVEAELVQGIAIDSFRSETSPDGTPWDTLDKKTLKRKLPGTKKLIATGRGRQTLTSKATKTGIEIGFGTDYMGYHQNGTKNMPARPMFPVKPNGDPMMSGPAKRYYEGMVQRFVEFLFESHAGKIEK